MLPVLGEIMYCIPGPVLVIVHVQLPDILIIPGAGKACRGSEGKV